jgi:hypothetical protein
LLVRQILGLVDRGAARGWGSMVCRRRSSLR